MTETIPVSFGFVVTLELKDNVHSSLDILLTLYIVLYNKLKKRISVLYGNKGNKEENKNKFKMTKNTPYNKT